jgi:arginyl-tRNA synthetase
MIRDGKEVRMSTRRGDYDTLDDLIDQTSADVVRYMLLARSPDSHLNFDLDLAVKQSNENPVYYIQNAHVRCAGIFREAEARGLTDAGADVNLLGADELRFIRKAMELGEVIALSAQTFEPHRIAFYAGELAGLFHPIYDNVRALHGDVPPDVAKARLRFYRAAQVVFKRVLTLMGMSAPERM